jgi:hypothetical protein
LATFLQCDVDNDGYESVSCGGDDCDDNNKDINPGAFDDCDSKDNDCDGLVDEGNCGTNSCVCSCPDGDGDGFRNWVCGGNDCNDTNLSINPNMADICDGIDNDCDGVIDFMEGFECVSCELHFTMFIQRNECSGS